MSEKLTWQPIETAPKDAVIDVWSHPYGRAADAQWSTSKGGWVEWGMDGLGSPGFCRIEGSVTHWMPLPEPPRALSEGDA